MKINKLIANLPDGFNRWVGTLPTTNFRIFITVIIWLGTAIAVWAGAAFSWEFYSMIVVMSGLDAMQFSSKRKTHTDYIKAKNGSEK